MLKRSLTILAVLALGLFLAGCEVQNDTDTASTDDVATGDTTPDTTPPDPCAADGVCAAACALDGTFDPDCFYGVAECADASATAILEAWFADANLTGMMSPTTRNCDWTPGVCDAQFRCDTVGSTPRPCFCDPDCYATDASGNPTGLIEPCGDDTHCDTWCPTGFDVTNCDGNPDAHKYCN